MEIQTTSAPQKALEDRLVGTSMRVPAAFFASSVSALRLMRHCLSLMLVGLLAGATAAKTQQGDRRIADLVQAGEVRVGLFPSFFYSKSQTTGELQGVGIEIARALAARLGVELLLVEQSGPAETVECLKSGACDVAYLGISTSRTVEVDFSPPYLQGDFTYLVPPGSPFRQIADADKPGVRIGVVRNHSMDFALRGKLRHAAFVYADTPDASFELLRAGHVTALAGIRPGLLTYSAALPGSQVLQDCYGSNVLAMAVPKGRAGWLGYISEFIADSKASGLVHQALTQTGTRGIQVASLHSSIERSQHRAIASEPSCSSSENQVHSNHVRGNPL
jgi:polar amino acid transport system substrate-binding protein